MYILRAVITINPKSQEDPRCNALLDQYQKKILYFLAPFHSNVHSDTTYYHPDEESEFCDIHFVARVIHLSRECKRFQLVLSLAQIIQAVTHMLNASNGVSLSCLILDPEIPNSPSS